MKLLIALALVSCIHGAPQQRIPDAPLREPLPPPGAPQQRRPLDAPPPGAPQGGNGVSKPPLDYIDYVCPEPSGDFVDYEYCDRYWHCKDGFPEERFCEDGHAFLPRLRGSPYPCDYLFKADCNGRNLTQDPLPGPDRECQRQHGIFPDPDLCDTYYECKDGQSTRRQCSTGTQVDLETRECVWPHQANRGPCNKREVLSDSNFTCPEMRVDLVDQFGHRNNNPTFPYPDDCRYFYVCLNGLRPTRRGCQDGVVYNSETGRCDDPANVPGCENYYEVDYIYESTDSLHN